MVSRSYIRELVNSRLLPKTGQLVSYVNFDDGYLERGWWQGRFNADNLNRFVVDTISGGIIVIDLATGLMWAKVTTAAGGNNGALINFADAISYADGLTFAGFSDWRLPNINELFSCVNHDVGVDPDFSHTDNPFISDYNVSSTTSGSDTTKCLHVDFSTCEIAERLKTATGYIKVVRDML